MASQNSVKNGDAQIEEGKKRAAHQPLSQQKKDDIANRQQEVFEERIKEIEERPSFVKSQKSQLTNEKSSSIPKKIDFSGLPQEAGESFTNYALPSLDLLEYAKQIDQKDVQNELKEKAALLEETLLSFGIEAKVGQIHCGPTVTLFEVHPAVGVKIGKIKALENDIALNMEAKSIRIIAPIPGKAAVGIEIPNQTPQTVTFQELLKAYLEKNLSYKIPMLLGKAVNGEWIITDLSKMPHCIIAGATGSGKSVCINSIVMSILMLARPDEIRLLMIDPKKVELTPYTNLPHMIAPVITEPHEAALSLNWLVHEMEKRYEILKLLGLRNIDSFNKRVQNKAREDGLPIDIPEKLPYYVGVIDELADLMMVSSQDIETPIARIAQMARAVGIHLILATQRPSREVITGLIKANFPARISFKVASRVNSQIILDDTGAETLLGNGDMLISLPGSSQLIRCQGVLVRDEEILKIIETIEQKYPTNYLIRSFQRMNEASASEDSGGLDSLDSRYHEAKDVVFSTGNASTTFLQRKLKIGYARAASIMDQLEDQGVIGPQEGAKPRKIFFPKKMEDEIEQDDLSLQDDIDPLISNEKSIIHAHGSEMLSNENQTRFQLLRDIGRQAPSPSSEVKENFVENGAIDSQDNNFS
ncbi:MAG: DNA translocase FtsK [Chlamydia sp.]